jgi:hypothetical protein
MTAEQHTLPPLTLTRTFELEGGDRHALARAQRHGAEHRLRRGVYVGAQHWLKLLPSERYRLRCRASSESQGYRPILSHFSAAAVHGIPIIGPWPDVVHRIVDRGSGGRSRGDVVAHATTLDAVEIVEVDGMLVTSMARTIVDLACVSTFMSGVASADFGLQHKRTAHLERADLQRAWESAMPIKAHARARRILEFATHLADSPAESASRANMFLGGFVMPRLQTPYHDAEGLIGYVDFDWEGHDHVGESDGKQKYMKDELLNARPPGEVVYEEKVREDRLRALNQKVTRWDWHRAVDLERLRPFLLEAGVPLRRRR